MGKFVFEYMGRMVKADSYESAFDLLGFGLIRYDIPETSSGSNRRIYIAGPVGTAFREIRHSYSTGGRGDMTEAEIKADIIEMRVTVYKNKAHW